MIRSPRMVVALLAAVTGTTILGASGRLALGAVSTWVDPNDPTGSGSDINAGVNLSGTYENAAHWQPAGAPGAGANVSFSAPGYPSVPYTVSFTASETVNTLSVSNTVTFNLQGHDLSMNALSSALNSASLVIANNASLDLQKGTYLSQSIQVGTSTAVTASPTFLEVDGSKGQSLFLVHSNSTINDYQTIMVTSGATFDTGDDTLVNMAPDIGQGGLNTGNIQVNGGILNLGDNAVLRGGSVVASNGGSIFANGHALTFDSVYYGNDLSLSDPLFVMNFDSTLLDPPQQNVVIPTTIGGAVDLNIATANVNNTELMLTSDSGNTWNSFTIVGNTLLQVSTAQITTGLLNLDGDGAPGTGSTTNITNAFLTVHDDMWVGELGNAQVNITGNGNLINIDGGLILGDQEGSSGTLAFSGLSNITVGINALNSHYGLGYLTIGNYGAGQMTISGGASVTVANGWNANVGLGMNADGTGGSGTLTVTGAAIDGGNDSVQSTLDLASAGGDLFVGAFKDSMGVVNIVNGGIVEDAGGHVGAGVGAVGTVLVDGGFFNAIENSTALSQWLNTGSVVIGDAGTGSLTVSNGATVDVGLSMFVGNGSSGFGQVLVTSSGALFINADQSATDNLSVGGSGIGRLDVVGGGVFDETNAYVGANTGGAGEITVSSQGALSALGELDIGYGGKGTLTVTGGSNIASGFGRIGISAGSIGNVLLDDSFWVIGSFLNVGEDGKATLTVQNGGTLSSGNVTIAENGDSSGGVTFNNSQWTNNGLITVGNGGPGSLTIQNDSVVSNSAGNVALLAGSSGTIVVDGTGSKWLSAGFLLIGNLGPATVSVTNGASISSIGAVIANGSASSSSVLVSGANSAWTDIGDLTVGNSGNGTLTIQSGGSVTLNGFVYIGGALGSGGQTIVNGVNSVLSPTGDVIVGNGGAGNLLIENGGKVLTGATSFLGVSAGAAGQALVTGAGSQWINTMQMAIGGLGDGTLTISAGALVSANAATSVSHTAVAIGQQGTGVGVVTVTDPGSELLMSGHLSVGFGNNGSNTTNGGMGNLSILNGGMVSDTNGYIGRYIGATGTASVSGNNARWVNTGALYIAANDAGDNVSDEVLPAGIGTLTVGAGGSVTAGATSVIGTAGTLSMQSGSYSAPSTALSGQITGYGNIYGPVFGSGSLTATGPSPLITDGLILPTVTVNNSLTLRPDNGTSGTSKIANLIIAGSTASGFTGTFDLTNNKLIIESTGATGNKATLLSTLRAMVDPSNIATGPWTNTTGITSSTVIADQASFEAKTTNYRTTIAVFDNGALIADLQKNSFGGQPVDSNSILVTRALQGDGNLDGIVDNADFVIISNHFGLTGQTWATGDYNGDGVVNNADFVVMSNNFGESIPGASFSLAPAGDMGSGSGLGSTGSAPEPTSLAAMLLGIPLLIRRRQRVRK